MLAKPVSRRADLSGLASRWRAILEAPGYNRHIRCRQGQLFGPSLPRTIINIRDSAGGSKRNAQSLGGVMNVIGSDRDRTTGPQKALTRRGKCFSCPRTLTSRMRGCGHFPREPSPCRPAPCVVIEATREPPSGFRSRLKHRPSLEAPPRSDVPSLRPDGERIGPMAAAIPLRRGNPRKPATLSYRCRFKSQDSACNESEPRKPDRGETHAYSECRRRTSGLADE